MQQAEAPKLFISYSWTSEEHKEWVLNLAKELRQSGVDVILDRWHLREGQDVHGFMEQMVSDPEIKHVAIICDTKYVQRANLRAGGVGIEAQIITPSIYQSHTQTKFVAVVTELDDDGRPIVPIYYGSKKWIAFFDPSSYSDNFESLLRWIFDMPMDLPPPIGSRPSFLSQDAKHVTLATTSLHRRAIDALRGGREYALGALTEYLDRVIVELENLRIHYGRQKDAEPDDLMIRSIEQFLPYRNELISCFLTVAMYCDGEPAREILHKFFENLIPFGSFMGTHGSWHPDEFDNYIFIIYELFLYLVAANLKYSKFEAVSYFLDANYFYASVQSASDNHIKDFKIFKLRSKTLEYRKQRLGISARSVEALLMKERAAGQPIEFKFVMMADFILYVRSRLRNRDLFYWFPFTLAYYDARMKMDVFARAQSAKYFEKIKHIFSVADIIELRRMVKEFDEMQNAPIVGFIPLSASYIMDLDNMASFP